MDKQVMTIKELAEVAGCSEKTVRKVIKTKYPNLIRNGVATKLTKEECFDIIGLLPKNNDLGIPRTKEGKVVQATNMVDRDLIKGMVVEIIKETIPQVIKETIAAIGVIPNLLPPDPRKEINAIIKKHARVNKIEHRDAWSYYYRRVYDRLGIDLRLRANNQNKYPLDVAEELNIMGELLALAMEEFNAV